jgi:hypothetical protein
VGIQCFQIQATSATKEKEMRLEGDAKTSKGRTFYKDEVSRPSYKIILAHAA